MAGQIVDDALLPDGEYELAYVSYRTQVAFKVPRVVVTFQVAEPGKYLGVELERWYRVKLLKGKPRRSGNFVVGGRSDLLREVDRVLRPQARLDRISFADLKGKVVICRVRTVREDSKQQPLSERASYSIVDELLRIG
jgi:hypothetical protein